jgi:hypothetical protein
MGRTAGQGSFRQSRKITCALSTLHRLAPNTHAHTHDGPRQAPRSRPDIRAQLTGPSTHTRDRLRRIELLPKGGQPERQGRLRTTPQIITVRQFLHVPSDVCARFTAMAAIGHARPFCTPVACPARAPAAAILASVDILPLTLPPWATPLWVSGLPALST